MKTNREEILQSALQLFMSMNYERVSLQMITRMVGLTKTGIFNYYPTKLDLFVAVADKYLFNAQDPKHKYEESDGTLMAEIVRLGNVRQEAMPGQSANAGYFHLFQQVLFYYPDGKAKLHAWIESEYDHWRSVIRRAIESGEINRETDVEEAVAQFRLTFVGMSFEMSFYEGLDVNRLAAHFRYIYNQLNLLLLKMTER